MNNDKYIVTLTVSELQNAILDSLRLELSKLVPPTKPVEEKEDEILLTRFEVAKIFKISTVSLDKWKKAKLLPEPVKIAGKVYYLKNEIVNLIKKHQRHTNGNI